MDLVTVIGLIAAFCTTTAFAPQAVKAWKTKHTKDISLYTFLLFVVGIILWLVYGLLLKDLPLVVANGASLILALVILFLKVKYG